MTTLTAILSKPFRAEVGVTAYIAMVAGYFSLVLNLPVTSKIYQLSATDSLFFVASSPLLLFFCFIIVFTLFSLPFVLKPFTVILTLLSSLAFYAAMKYNVMFDYGMVENIFETNPGEAASYISLSSVLYFVFAGLIPAIYFGTVIVKKAESPLRAILERVVAVVAALLGIALIALLFYKDYASVGRNNSYLNKMINPAFVYNAFKYAKRNYFTEPLVYQPLGEDAKLPPAPNGKPNLVVLVVGETARAMNYHYNGYRRDTNPYTEGMGLIAFQHVTSCGTSTAVSVPCMFSNMGRQGYSKARASSRDNAMDVIGHAGVNLSWVDNDGGDKGIAKHFRLLEVDHTAHRNLCQDGACYDEVLPPMLDQLVESTEGSQLIAFHIMGSHGPTYYRRYPREKARFLPDCPRSDIEHCSDEQIVNTYDNTIAYTDFVLAEMINKLKTYQDRYNVALMYISDHGESLGENGIYLHGTPFAFAPREQTQVPWLLWIPEQYAAQNSIDRACLSASAKNGEYSHNNVFHTLIGFFGVTTQDKNDALDITSQCHKMMS
ncbi:phosphoethanolamine--lipid A transferase [Photobacterium rosenbergii]|uniref:Phosphoethanolamine--lipid A transferase n=1 Tax=Photobacterium rosenbergii TaxID=294936 RepID=A0ABU3ZQE7_9GAMM|nr:phosphoethanolamine--lipid A transferase [Photobacterium rosenbergii]MDV5172349.1 phosphoethanolamine--lipid A transferase [Photobacterium rosenbergii]